MTEYALLQQLRQHRLRQIKRRSRLFVLFCAIVIAVVLTQVINSYDVLEIRPLLFMVVKNDRR